MSGDALFVPEEIDRALHMLCRVYGEDIANLLRNYTKKQGRWQDLGALATPHGAQGMVATLTTLEVIIKQAILAMEESSAARAGGNK